MTDSEKELVARLLHSADIENREGGRPSHSELVKRNAADAIERLSRERDEARAELADLKAKGWKEVADEYHQRTKAAEAEVARLREALQFYADENVWRDQPYMRIDHLGRECEDMEQAAVFGDYGDIARAALEAK